MKETIFLTGSTGLLGSYILKHLLVSSRTNGVEVVALVRGKTQKDAERRILEILRKMSPSKSVRKNISLPKVVCGDIAEKKLGLKKSTYNNLIAKVGLIYHSAALTEFSMPFSIVKRVNVDGTRNVLDFALDCQKKGSFKQVHHISTVAVAGDRKGIFYENQLDVGQKFNNTYERAKFETEKLVATYRNKGLLISVYRPAIIVGDSRTGYTNNFKMFYQPLHLFSLGLFKEIPADKNTIYSFVPVDHTADAIIRISSSKDVDKNSTYHITNPNMVRLDYIIDTASRYFGFQKPIFVKKNEVCIKKFSQLQHSLLDPFTPYLRYKIRFDAEMLMLFSERLALNGQKLTARSLGNYTDFALLAVLLNQREENEPYQILETTAKGFLDKPAIIEDGKETTYRKLWEIIDKTAKAFLDMGIKEGDRIAIGLPNCKEYIYAFLAILKINAIAVPLKQVITSYELRAILKDCHPSLLITDSVFLTRMLPFDPVVTVGKLVICSRHIMKKGTSKRAIRIDDLFNWTSIVGTTFQANEDTVASINYTYRGYGYPLGAMLTHKNLKAGTMTYVNTTGITPGQKILLALPMSHVYSLIGCVTVPLSTGSSIVITKRSDPKEIIKLINSFRIDVITSVPTFYMALLKANEKLKLKLHRVQHCFSGGSLLQLATYQEVREKMGWDIRQGYGLTECLPVTCNPSSPNNPASIGKVGVGAKVKVIDESGNEGKINEIGEIIAGGDSIMAGYYRHPKESKEVLVNGWCHTGDYGYFDSEGYLYFTGLKKRIAKVGGNMVDLEEVRKAIRFFPGIVDANIGTVIDEFWGHILTAEVSVKNLKEFDTRKLRSFLRDRLVSYKVPHIKKVSSYK